MKAKKMKTINGSRPMVESIEEKKKKTFNSTIVLLRSSKHKKYKKLFKKLPTPYKNSLSKQMLIFFQV